MASIISIEPRETNILLPGFFIGYELELMESTCADDLPEWIIAIDTQAKGYSVYPLSMVGVLLRFSDNIHCGYGDVADLIRGFQEICDTKLIDKEYPTLLGLAFTWGEPYERWKLRLLDIYLSRFFRLPKLAAGFEPVIRMASCNPLDYFDGWSMLSVPEPRPVIDDQKINFIWDFNINQFKLSAEIFDHRVLETVRMVGQRILHQPREPDVYLMWENSD